MIYIYIRLENNPIIIYNLDYINMKRYALLDLIKFHELENETEQTKFIRK